jgi:phosphoglycerate dehydrogenase-like enzyme
VGGTNRPGGDALSGSDLVVLVSPLFGAPLADEQLARIEAEDGVRAVRISPDGRLHADQPGELLDRAEVLLRGSMPSSVLDHLLGRSTQLRWVHSASAGVEKVVTSLARSRRLTVTNARGVFSRPIAEYVVMMLLAIARRLPQLLELHRERTWQPLPAREVSDLTLGIIGFGSIGQEVARLLEPFGTPILATRRNPEQGTAGLANVRVMAAERLDEVLHEADVVLLAAPLTTGTERLIGARELNEMRSGSWLINIARGPLVDELALQRALKAGWIGGAVLDVFEEQPLSSDSPLYRTPNLIITPHTSWWSGRALERTVDLFIDNLRRYRAGDELRNVVDLEAGY